MRVALVIVLLIGGGCASLYDLDVPPNVDRDNDTHRDRADNCPAKPNPDQSDFDRDGAGDACDECVDGGGDDADGDGIPDGCDGCIGNGMDEDDDGIPDNCDGCLESGEDVDQDSVDDACDACIGNFQDIDGDQIDDACDPCINSYLDLDEDGIDDGCDACIASGLDSDGDGLDNACDPCNNGPQHDEDGDTHYDDCDNCSAVANLDQSNSSEITADGTGDACEMDGEINYEVFDGFASSNPAWFVQGANWSLGADVMTYLGGGPSYRLLGYGNTTFKVSVAVVDVVGTGYVSVIAANQYIQPAPTRIECRLDAMAGSTATSVTVSVYDGAAPPVIVSSTKGADQSSAILTLEVNEPGKTIRCSDSLSGTEVETSTEPTGMSWLTGIAVEEVTVSFPYFDVITR